MNYLENLIKESQSFGFGRGRKQIKPFGSYDEILKLLNEPKFLKAIETDEKFYLFIRKKLFWVLGSPDNMTRVQFKEFGLLKENENIVTIADQVLLTYFGEEMTFAELECIAFRRDVYNSLTAWKINAERGAKSHANLN